jgi:hypothetical protein
MNLIHINDATSSAPRFRVPEPCVPAAAGAVNEGRVIAGTVALVYGVTVVSFKDAAARARAWSPPV